MPTPLVVDDLLVLPEVIIPGGATDGIPSFSGAATFRWLATAPGRTYEIFVDGEPIAATVDTTVTWTFPPRFPAGLHRLWIDVRDGDRYAGGSERSWVFRHLPAD